MISTSLRVRFYETDMMEIAHHTNHLRWFEMGRIEYFRRCGISLWDMMQEGIVFPITKVASLSRAQCTFTYRIIRESDGALICTGETQNVFTAKETGKIIRLPDIFFKPMKAVAEEE